MGAQEVQTGQDYPCHRGRGPETGCSEQAFLDKMCAWALGNTQL